MKISLAIILSGLVTFLSTSCDQSTAKATEKIPENGAQFREGQGLTLTDEMKNSIGFKTAAVTEEKISSTITLDLTATATHEARSHVPSTSPIKPGMEITIDTLKGTVRELEKIPFGVAGDLEAIIAFTDALAPGKSYQGTLHLPATSPVAAVPTSALLTTAEGTFVYTLNENAYLRTPVKIGASDTRFVEITDGLYTGDEIVTTPVMSLWMAELQVLRGGKACTCGH